MTQAPLHIPRNIEGQRAIARILSALDNKIDLNRRTNEALEAMARMMFKDWFVDFGPTRAKAEGRPSYLVPELWSLFPAALDDDDKPVGWRIGALSDLANLNPESWTAQTAPNEIEYVDLSNTKWGQIIGKYLSSLRKLDYVLVRKEGLKTQL